MRTEVLAGLTRDMVARNTRFKEAIGLTGALQCHFPLSSTPLSEPAEEMFLQLRISHISPNDWHVAPRTYI
jgi:hypothetical protein